MKSRNVVECPHGYQKAVWAKAPTECRDCRTAIRQTHSRKRYTVCQHGVKRSRGAKFASKCDECMKAYRKSYNANRMETRTRVKVTCPHGVQHQQGSKCAWNCPQCLRKMRYPHLEGTPVEVREPDVLLPENTAPLSFAAVDLDQWKPRRHRNPSGGPAPTLHPQHLCSDCEEGQCHGQHTRTNDAGWCLRYLSRRVNYDFICRCTVAA